MKFKVVKASEVNPDTLVITRTDGQSVKSDTLYLNINLSKSHGKECYEVLKRHGYNIPEVEEFLDSLNPPIFYDNSDEIVDKLEELGFTVSLDFDDGINFYIVYRGDYTIWVSEENISVKTGSDAFEISPEVWQLILDLEKTLH